MSAPPLQVVEAGPREASASVIWLHGLGADGWDFHPIVPELGLPPQLAVRFVFPHAPVRPVTLNGGMPMRAWYDIRALDLDARSHDEPGIRAAHAAIDALIASEEARGIPAGRIVLAGFSQGGAMTLFAGPRYPRRLAGLIALSCYLLLPDRMAAEAAPANAALPVFLAHGTHDPMVPFIAGEHARGALTEAGHTVEWHAYDMPHAVHPDEIAAIGAWLTRTLR